MDSASNIDKQNLLDKLTSADRNDLVKKESEKNTDEQAAQTRLNISQISNKERVGKFAVDWLINVISISSFVIFLMVCIYLIKICDDEVKLKEFLHLVYSQITAFIYKYQAVLTGFVVFMFGDAVKKSEPNTKK